MKLCKHTWRNIIRCHKLNHKIFESYGHETHRRVMGVIRSGSHEEV